MSRQANACRKRTVGGDLHEFGKLGKLVSAKEAESVI
jgi:hypothetical protein